MQAQGDDLLSRIERIEAEMELRRLINRYHRCADAFDWIGWANCFTEDSVYELPSSFGRMDGRQAIHDVCKANMHEAFQSMQHIIVNLDFDVDLDAATGDANFIFAAVPNNQKRGQNYICGGRYHWVFRRETAGWLISHTVAEYVWNVGNATGGAFGRSESKSG